MRYNIILIFNWYTISSLLGIIHSEVFTALVHLENLLHTEGEIVKTLEKYLEIEEKRLQKVRWLSKEYVRLHRAASGNVETFLSNPINAYLLVKRLTADWKVTEELIDDQLGREIIENFTLQDHLKFPDEEDLSGAAAALMRLQNTYLLNTTALAHGLIEGTEPSPELTGSDCFELGRQAFNLKDYYHAALWMQEALNRIEKDIIDSLEKVAVLEYMAYSVYMLGNVKYAEKLTKELFSIDPEHPRARGNLEIFAEILQKHDLQRNGSNDNITSELQTKLYIKKPGDHTFPEKQEYERLCRGEHVKSPAEESELRCQYVTNNNSLLILQPAQEEELNLIPRIVVYHNVLSDREIEVIKNLAQPKLARALVHNTKSGQPEYVNYRISKSAWLRDEHHEVVKLVSQRIEAITGLETDTSEDLQVVNYGIGGHYEPHFDFIRKDERDVFKYMGTGNRIATWINYMSDVDAGGATVFPSIGVQVKPTKGSAAFWFNLFRNGEGDLNTRHAACPVLAGSKWVSNKWFHERGQEFRRPCSLDPEV